MAIVAAVCAVLLTAVAPSLAAGTPVQAGVVAEVTSVPASVLKEVGPGSILDAQPYFNHVSGSTLTVGGKPELLYAGEDFCPYCSAEQWALVVALSRFGTFTGLNEVRSSSHRSLQALTPAQKALMHKYQPSELAGSVPFIDIGNSYVELGSMVDPSVLRGRTWTQVAQALHNPSSPVA
jgi:hypothetical protein